MSASFLEAAVATVPADRKSDRTHMHLLRSRGFIKWGVPIVAATICTLAVAAGRFDFVRRIATRQSEDELLLPHVADSPAEAKVRETGTPVWVLVGYWKAADKNVERVARDYAVPSDVVKAALRYYSKHRAPIDARLVLSRTA